jgi:hypothetical protein
MRIRAQILKHLIESDAQFFWNAAARIPHRDLELTTRRSAHGLYQLLRSALSLPSVQTAEKEAAKSSGYSKPETGPEKPGVLSLAAQHDCEQ